MDPIYLNGPSAPTPTAYSQVEIDDDDEDQLDSDLDDEPIKIDDGAALEPDIEEDVDEEHVATNGNGRRKVVRKSGERVVGQTLLPQTRLENILRADGGWFCWFLSGFTC